ncbi:hypothetical protein COLO4_05585 [Corchorus olitorius]|uniref:Uncharacterized protein n=1 Tax=Corchorus olitorius TaxID=93759 RepID=A0A1R3KQF8_9ROSI|nr:hypothetical protein COLO4_05585 [Corchorus olitorius]
MERSGVKTLVIMLLLLSLTVKPHEAIRVPADDDLKLKGRRATMEFDHPQDHSDPKIGPNPCSYTPNPPAGPCNHP